MSFFSDFGGDIINSVTNLASIPLQSYYNRKSASKANDYALYSWNLANEYNHPAEQMKRFEEAGLNKNLIYGQQNITNAFGTTGPAAPDVQGAMRNSILDYYTVQNMKKSNDKLNAEIVGIEAGIQNQNVKTLAELWDLIQRIDGGYGSDSSPVEKTLGATFKHSRNLVDKATTDVLTNPDSVVPYFLGPVGIGYKMYQKWRKK